MSIESTDAAIRQQRACFSVTLIHIGIESGVAAEELATLIKLIKVAINPDTNQFIDILKSIKQVSPKLGLELLSNLQEDYISDTTNDDNDDELRISNDNLKAITLTTKNIIYLIKSWSTLSIKKPMEYIQEFIEGDVLAYDHDLVPSLRHYGIINKDDTLSEFCISLFMSCRSYQSGASILKVMIQDTKDHNTLLTIFCSIIQHELFFDIESEKEYERHISYFTNIIPKSIYPKLQQQLQENGILLNDNGIITQISDVDSMMSSTEDDWATAADKKRKLSSTSSNVGLGLDNNSCNYEGTDVSDYEDED